MNDVYQSSYQHEIYSPIYLPPIIFYDDEDTVTGNDIPDAEA